MKILLPFIALAALSACGTNTANETATVNAAGTGDGAIVEPMDNAMMANDTMGSAAMAPSGTGGAVTVTVNGVKPNAGPVLVALQDSTSFAKAAGTYNMSVDATGASVTATFQGVAPGQYAAAVVQDTNSDGTLTLGATGPSEPYGFSGAKQTGAPTFEPAAFEVAATGGTATVTIAGGK